MGLLQRFFKITTLQAIPLIFTSWNDFLSKVHLSSKSLLIFRVSTLNLKIALQAILLIFTSCNYCLLNRIFRAIFTYCSYFDFFEGNSNSARDSAKVAWKSTEKPRCLCLALRTFIWRLRFCNTYCLALPRAEPGCGKLATPWEVIPVHRSVARLRATHVEPHGRGVPDVQRPLCSSLPWTAPLACNSSVCPHMVSYWRRRSLKLGWALLLAPPGLNPDARACSCNPGYPGIVKLHLQGLGQL